MLTINEIRNYLTQEKRKKFDTICNNFNLEEGDLEIALYPDLKPWAKKASVHFGNSFYQLIKLPATFSFVSQNGKRYGISLTQRGIEKHKEYFHFCMLPNAIHAGHFNVARYIIRENENFFSLSSIIPIFVSYTLLENFENPPEDLQNIFKSKLENIVTEAAYTGQLINLLSMGGDGKRCSLIKNLITNTFSHNNKASINLLKYVITKAACTNQLISLLSMDSDDTGCKFITNLLANACANNNQTAIDLLDYIVTAAAHEGQLISLLNMDSDGKGCRFIINLLTDARAHNNQTSIDLLEYIVTAAAHEGQLISLLNMNSDDTGCRFIKNLLANACANNNWTSINLLMYIITAAALEGQLTILLGMDNNDEKRKFIENILATAFAHNNPASVHLLKYAITAAACNDQLTSLLSMDSDGKRCSFIKKLLANAYAHNNPASIDLLKHAITAAARTNQLKSLLSIDSNSNSKRYILLIVNLLSNACASRNNRTSKDLLKHAITEAAQNGQLISLLSMNSDNMRCSFIANLLGNARANNNQTSIELLKHVITEAANTGQLINLLSMNSNDKKFRIIKNLLANTYAHNNPASIDLLKHAITEAAREGQLMSLLSMDSNDEGRRFITDLVNGLFSRKEVNQQLSIELLDCIAMQIKPEQTELRQKFYNCVLCAIRDHDPLKIINQMGYMESPFLELIKEQYKRETGRELVPIKDKKFSRKWEWKMIEHTNPPPKRPRLMQPGQYAKGGEQSYPTKPSYKGSYNFHETKLEGKEHSWQEKMSNQQQSRMLMFGAPCS